jgi:hypothetical protein
MNSHAAERLLSTVDWSRLRSVDGTGDRVHRALQSLLSAKSADVATTAYWEVENHAFVQGELFEVAESCAAVLISSLLDDRPRWVRIAALELMFQILGGHASTSQATPEDIVQRCHRAVRDGLWLLYREMIGGERDAALDVLDQLGEKERALKLLGIMDGSDDGSEPMMADGSRVDPNRVDPNRG